jgi:multiple sugar transport system permease protein
VAERASAVIDSTVEVSAEVTPPPVRTPLPVEQIVIYTLLTLAAIFALLPLLWGIAASFTPNQKVFEYAYPFSFRAFLPVDFTLEAYQSLFEGGFGRAIVNTLFLGLITVVLGGLISSMAGFAFARFNFRGKNLLFAFVLIAFTVPGDFTTIPRYILVNRLDWINTWQALLVPGLASSFAIFLSRQFFAEIPQDLLDAARVDGASWLRVFRSVILPLSKPVLISAGLLLFLGQWDSFFWPLLVAPQPGFRVVQVAITMAAAEQFQTDWSLLMAGSMTAAIIPILLVLPFQRYYVRAITGSGLKE